MLAELARHFTAAASIAGPAKAVYYARRAAAQAMRSVAYDEAIAHLESALALSRGDSTEAIDLELELGSALCRKGDNQQAMQVFQRAFRAAREARAGGAGGAGCGGFRLRRADARAAR